MMSEMVEPAAAPETDRLKAQNEALRAENRRLRGMMMLPRALRLTPAQGVALRCLLAASPDFVHRDRIFSELYDIRGRGSESRSVDVMICVVREKLRPHGIVIMTIKGVGYAIDEENAARLLSLAGPAQDDAP